MPRLLNVCAVFAQIVFVLRGVTSVLNEAVHADAPTAEDSAVVTPTGVEQPLDAQGMAYVVPLTINCISSLILNSRLNPWSLFLKKGRPAYHVLSNLVHFILSTANSCSTVSSACL